jgi:hypothetical protein
MSIKNEAFRTSLGEFTFKEEFLSIEWRKISDLFKCLICFDIVKAPQECSTCSSLFCGECIKKWISNSTSCPNKCEILFINNINRKLYSILELFTFRCLNVGCDIICSYKYYANHLLDCQYTDYYCIAIGCSYKNSKTEVIKHSSSCIFTESQCQYYSESLKHSHLKVHEELCEETK